MNYEAYLALASGPDFMPMVNRLRAEPVPTRQLLGIVDAVKLIHNQLANGGPRLGDSKLRVKGALFLGESGSGKSYALNYAAQILPDLPAIDGQATTPRTIYVETPAWGTVGVLAREIVFQCDNVYLREPKDSLAPGKAISAVSRHDLTLVTIDEVNFILTKELHGPRAFAVQSQLFFSTVIGMLNLPVPIVLAGLPCVEDAFKIQDSGEERTKVRREAQSRLNIHRIPPASAKKDRNLLEGAIAGYCAIAGVESIITADDMIVERLIHGAFDQIGTALEIAQMAVAMAYVRKNSKLTRANFGIAYKIHTDAVNAANPFLVNDWERIDVSVISPQSGRAARFQERAK